MAKEDLKAKLAEMTKERDAYKKAKEENDERFMRERDDARAKAEEFRVEMDKQTAMKLEERQAKLEAQRMMQEMKDADGVLKEVQMERARQDAKWGEQNHPDGTCAGPNGAVMAKQHADAARSVCDQMAKIGKLTWAHILTEELMEAYAETDEQKLRKELIQTAAVAVSWIEAIDRRIRGRASGQ